MMFLFSLQIFHEQGLYPIAKSGCVGQFGLLFDFGGLGRKGKECPECFNKLHL